MDLLIIFFSSVLEHNLITCALNVFISLSLRFVYCVGFYLIPTACLIRLIMKVFFFICIKMLPLHHEDSIYPSFLIVLIRTVACNLFFIIIASTNQLDLFMYNICICQPIGSLHLL